MIEVRDIKLDILMGNQNPIVDLFNEIIDGIRIINCDVYNNTGLEFIYFKDNEWIFYQDIKNKSFWCHNDRYWLKFKDEFKLEYEVIQSITKYLVEDALKRELDAPYITARRTRYDFGESDLKVEDALKRELDAPSILFKHNNRCKVEEALNREIENI